MANYGEIKMAVVANSLDGEIGDGTTGVVGLAGSSSEQAEQLLDRGNHPMKVSDDRKMEAKSCSEKLDRISDTFVFSKKNTVPFIQTAMNTLGN